jgi:hypothetical protein
MRHNIVVILAEVLLIPALDRADAAADAYLRICQARWARRVGAA